MVVQIVAVEILERIEEVVSRKKENGIQALIELAGGKGTKEHAINELCSCCRVWVSQDG